MRAHSHLMADRSRNRAGNPLSGSGSIRLTGGKEQYVHQQLRGSNEYLPGRNTYNITTRSDSESDEDNHTYGSIAEHNATANTTIIPASKLLVFTLSIGQSWLEY